MDRRSFLKIVGAGAAALALPGRVRAAGDERKPNILMIYADDLGYGDLGCYGGKLVATPNIDRLAAAGVRCTDGYATAPVCAPSRCGLMTGAYQQRFGMQGNTDRNAPGYVIPREHKLMPEAMKAAGYVTGHIGKWNVKREAAEAFDEVYELIDWEADYFSDEQGNYIGVNGGHASGKRQGVWGPWREGDEYLTDRLGRRAAEFIEKHKAETFFLYLAFNAVHSPWQAKKADEARFAHIENETLRFYAAMLASLDENVGRVLDKLKAAGLEENTLVVFVSDNGPAYGSPSIQGWPADRWPTPVLAGSAGPLNGHKGQMYEGGIREPFILRWPARLKAGQVYREPVITMDLHPTFLAAAGAAIPEGTKLDGVNLLPYLGGEKSGAPHERLFWKMGATGAVRQGDWKLVVWHENSQQLFNLKEDLEEQRVLNDAHPEVKARLYEAWKQWGAAMPKARSETAPPAGKGKKGKAKKGKAKQGGRKQ